MKKNGWMLTLFIVIGLLAGSILSHVMQSVSWLSFLTNSLFIKWTPEADLNFIKYDLLFEVKLNTVHLLCVLAAIWSYRRL